MKVLITITSDARRGAEIEADGLVSRLRGAGHDVGFAALASSGHESTLDVDVLGPSSLHPSTLRSLRRRAADTDVTIAFGSRTLPACAIALLGSGVPFVYRSIGDPTAWQGGRLTRMRTGLAMRRADRVVALWPDAAEAIARLYGVDSARLDVVGNTRPVDPTPIDRTAARSRFGLPLDVPVVAIVGALSEEKRVDRAITAVARLPVAHLLVVGDGPVRNEAERLAATHLPGRCTFAGAIDDVAAAYGAADALVSTSRTEGMPGVLLEAGAAGVPVVATAVGAVPWLFAQGLGGLCVPADAGPSALADALDAVLAAPRPSQFLGPSPDDVAAAWEAILGRVADRQRPTTSR